MGCRSVVEVMPRLALHVSAERVPGNDVAYDLDGLSSRHGIGAQVDTEGTCSTFGTWGSRVAGSNPAVPTQVTGLINDFRSALATMSCAFSIDSGAS